MYTYEEGLVLTTRAKYSMGDMHHMIPTDIIP